MNNSGKIVLLVDDNPNDVELTLRALGRQKLGNTVVAVSDGVEALEYLNREGPHAGRDEDEWPVVALVDLNMPRMGGLALLKELRANEHTRRLPVVILTTSKEDQDIVRSYDLGANSFVRKPVDFNEFVEAVRQLGLYWLLLNEAPQR